MSKYKYKSPLNRGFEKMRKEESKVVMNECNVKRKWNEKIVLYKKGNIVYYENLTPMHVKLLETLLVPIYLTVHISISIINVANGIMKEVYELWFQRKTGSYTHGYVNLKSDKELL